MKTAIVIGATSGIGKELARIFSANGFAVGITGRREALLEELGQELGAGTRTAIMDVRATTSAVAAFHDLISRLQRVDIVVISSGIGHLNPTLDWTLESETIATNVLGFTALATAAFTYFQQAGGGHLVGISSIAAIRGSGLAPAYNASKAFVSNYLEGLRQKARKERLSIHITDVQSGLVDTAMAKGEGLFWVAPASKAARQIFEAIVRRDEQVYVTKRWRLVAWLLKLLPNRIYDRL